MRIALAAAVLLASAPLAAQPAPPAPEDRAEAQQDFTTGAGVAVPEDEEAFEPQEGNFTPEAGSGGEIIPDVTQLSAAPRPA
jgi:hypothetical protein